MKPEDLPIPFPKDERQVLIKDQIWYIPNHHVVANGFAFPGWDHASLFGNQNPVRVEYCSGNGAWIAAMAIENPLINWVAVEIKFMRARKIWSKIKNHNLSNLIVVNGEGRNATVRYFPKNSIQEVYINFPDPWPKSRHAKNRIIQTSFLDEMSRILTDNGKITFVTDDKAYSQWTIEHIQRHLHFTSVYPDPYYITDWPSYGESYFDSLWREKGKTIHYHQFAKRNIE